MNWLTLREKGADYAFSAESARRAGDMDLAERMYAEAAVLEAAALELIPPDKIRTVGIVGVSACSLYFKAKDTERAEKLALNLLARSLPEFAQLQLQSVLQAVWNESVKRKIRYRISTRRNNSFYKWP